MKPLTKPKAPNLITKLSNGLQLCIVLVALCALPACQKCMQCDIVVTSSNGQKESTPYQEVCGNKTQFDGQRQGCESAAVLAP